MNEQQLAKILKSKQVKAASEEARINSQKETLQQYYSKAILDLLPEIKSDAKMIRMCDKAGVKFPKYINEAGNPCGAKFHPCDSTGEFGLMEILVGAYHPDNDYKNVYKETLGWSYLDWGTATVYGIVCTPTGELVRRDMTRGLRRTEDVAPEQYKEFYLKYLKFHKEFHEFLSTLSE